MPTGPLRLIGAALAAALIAFLTACAPEAPKEPVPPKLTIKPTRFEDLEGWRTDTQAEALDTFAKSCAKLVVQPKDRAVGVAGTVADWVAPCSALPQVLRGDDAAARTFFETWFLPYLAADNDNPDGLFTGYYEAELRGSSRPGGRYAV